MHKQSQIESLLSAWSRCLKSMQHGLTCNAQQVVGDDLPGLQLGVLTQHVNELADGACPSQHSLILQVAEDIGGRNVHQACAVSTAECLV